MAFTGMMTSRVRSGTMSAGFSSMRPKARMKISESNFSPTNGWISVYSRASLRPSARVATISTASSCFSSTQSSYACCQAPLSQAERSIRIIGRSLGAALTGMVHCRAGGGGGDGAVADLQNADRVAWSRIRKLWPEEASTGRELAGAAADGFGQGSRMGVIRPGGFFGIGHLLSENWCAGVRVFA